MNFNTALTFLFLFIFLTSCSDENGYFDNTSIEVIENLDFILEPHFSSNISFANPENYDNQAIPDYITKDNTNGNTITNEKTTLGRILFYDVNLSTDNTVSCATCHQQANAFSDNENVSRGVNGVTGRHSMRLINARFADEVRFFWNERVASLEEQTTQPIQDHAEMGFSGQNGDQNISDLLIKLSNTDYYPSIFEYIYGDSNITETRLQECLAQFVRSIQSFDSKYDIGRNQVANDNQPFPNFTAQENQGKTLFLLPPNQGGAGCAGCHRAPEFDIDPVSLNNGIIGVFGSSEFDFDVTRAPSLRNVVKTNGSTNGNLMHDASMSSLLDVVNHYNSIDPAGNTNLDNRLTGGPGQNGQQLNLTEDEKLAIVAFLNTLSGTDVYTNPKWSNPFN